MKIPRKTPSHLRIYNPKEKLLELNSLSVNPCFLLFLNISRDWHKGIVRFNDITLAGKFNVSTRTISRWRKACSKSGLLRYRLTGRSIRYDMRPCQKWLEGKYIIVPPDKTKLSAPNIYESSSPNNLSIYTDEEMKLAERIAEWGTRRAKHSSYKTPGGYVKDILPHINRLGIEPMNKIFERSEDNREFWNQLKKLRK